MALKKWNTNLHLEYSCTDQVNRSAQHLYGNLGENFPSNSIGLVFFFSHRKQEWDCVVPFTIFGGNLALIIQTDGSGNFVRFDKSGEKSNISEGITFSPELPDLPYK